MFSYYVDYQILNVYPHRLHMRVRAWTTKGATKKALRKLRQISVGTRFKVLSVKKGGANRG